METNRPHMGQPEWVPHMGQPEWVPHRGQPEWVPHRGQPEWVPHKVPLDIVCNIVEYISFEALLYLFPSEALKRLTIYGFKSFKSFKSRCN